MELGLSPEQAQAYITACSVLSLSLHSLPGASLAKDRRCRADAWLESAGVLAGPPAALVLSFLCPWSPAHACVGIALDTLALAPLPCALCAEGAAALAAVCAALSAAAPRPALANLPALLTRSIERAAQAIWVLQAPGGARGAALAAALPPVRAAVEGALVGAVAALQAHPQAAPLGALEGLALTLSLLVCAKGSAKAPLICRPVPPWLMASGSSSGSGGSSSSSGGGGDGPFSQQADVDAGALGAALAGVPRLSALAARWPACAAALPLDALLLLHWLACLAPVHLVRAAGAPSIPGATASFLALHGPPCPPPPPARRLRQPAPVGGQRRCRPWRLWRHPGPPAAPLPWLLHGRCLRHPPLWPAQPVWHAP